MTDTQNERIRKDEAWVRQELEKLERKDMKTLHNTDIADAVGNQPDVKVYGDGDGWQLICKVSSQSEGWMKSTKAMEIAGLGCLVQVTTQQYDNIAEAVTFVPGARIVEDHDHGGCMLQV